MKINLYNILIIAIILLSSSLSAQTDIGSNWRGPNRDGKYPETGLLKSWPENGPELLWSYEGIGEGHSSVSIDGDNVFVTGMTDSTGYLYKFNKSGELLWKKEYGLEWTRNFPGPRSTPTIYKNKVYFLSGRGDIVCYNKENGDKIWSYNILEKTDGENIRFGITENLLIINNKVICVPGGKTKNVLALNADNGEILWESSGLGEASAFCSPKYINNENGSIIVTHTRESIIALDPTSGKMLWSHLHSTKKDIHPNTPLYHNGEIFCISGYDMGCKKFKLTENNTKVELVWKNDSSDNKMGGLVLVDGYLYGSGDFKKGWKCIDWKTGEEKYKSTELKGNGVTIYADGLLYQYSDKGIVALVKPNPEKHEVLSQFKVPLGTKQHWAHPVIDNGKLYIRHGNALMAYSIKK